MKKAETTGAGQPLRLVTTEVPKPPQGGALVKTTFTGICHSDIHINNDTSRKDVLKGAGKLSIV